MPSTLLDKAFGILQREKIRAEGATKISIAQSQGQASTPAKQEKEKPGFLNLLGFGNKLPEPKPVQSIFLDQNDFQALDDGEASKKTHTEFNDSLKRFNQLTSFGTHIVDIIGKLLKEFKADGPKERNTELISTLKDNCMSLTKHLTAANPRLTGDICEC